MGIGVCFQGITAIEILVVNGEAFKTGTALMAGGLVGSRRVLVDTKGHC